MSICERNAIDSNQSIVCVSFEVGRIAARPKALVRLYTVSQRVVGTEGEDVKQLQPLLRRFPRWLEARAPGWIFGRHREDAFSRTVKRAFHQEAANDRLHVPLSDDHGRIVFTPWARPLFGNFV